jgi:hypothetical protein
MIFVPQLVKLIYVSLYQHQRSYRQNASHLPEKLPQQEGCAAAILLKLESFNIFFNLELNL